MLAPAVAALLRTVPCIPTASGGFVAPAQALVCSHPHTLRLVASQQLREALGLQLVHPQMAALQENPRLRRLLGIADMNPAQVYSIAQGF